MTKAQLHWIAACAGMTNARRRWAPAFAAMTTTAINGARENG
jgi:hypothetical protein